MHLQLTLSSPYMGPDVEDGYPSLHFQTKLIPNDKLIPNNGLAGLRGAYDNMGKKWHIVGAARCQMASDQMVS